MALCAGSLECRSIRVRRRLPQSDRGIAAAAAAAATAWRLHQVGGSGRRQERKGCVRRTDWLPGLQPRLAGDSELPIPARQPGSTGWNGVAASASARDCPCPVTESATCLLCVTDPLGCWAGLGCGVPSLGATVAVAVVSVLPAHAMGTGGRQGCVPRAGRVRQRRVGRDPAGRTGCECAAVLLHQLLRW